MNKPLMPMATAVWLIDNTTLSFRQIAKFCGLHHLEVQGIADETVGQNIVGIDPTLTGQLDPEEIKKAEADPSYAMQITVDEVPAAPRTSGPRYTPVSKRQDKPDAIAWLVRNHPELTDAQISKLVGTTKPTINAIRDRSHWNIQNITPNDPVGLGLCSQSELDEAVRKGLEREERKRKKEEREARKAAREAGLPEPGSEEAAAEAAAPEPMPEPEPEPEPEAGSESAEEDKPSGPVGGIDLIGD